MRGFRWSRDEWFTPTLATVVGSVAIAALLVAALALRSARTARERFGGRLALAKEAGLLKARREDAALIYLDRATTGRRPAGPDLLSASRRSR